MKPFEITGLPPDELSSFLSATHADPFRVLGPHRLGNDLTIRMFRPDAKKIDIVLERQANGQITAEKIHRDGFFCATVPGATRELDYRVRITEWDGSEWITRDPYQYGPIMGEVDLHLFSEGQHWQLYEKFGAHLRTIGDETGVYFAVWAPNAQRVSVVGDFNGWDGRVNPMRKLLGTGTWELFLPGIGEGTLYKYEIKDIHGAIVLKTDPYGFFFESAPKNASIIWNNRKFAWTDDAWLKKRREQNPFRSPVSIYEVHPGSLRNK